ncbi:orotidine-5'-phosphate decarboxylase [Bacteroidota bacterium]
MTAKDKLKRKTDQNFHICVGLDTDINKIPPYLKKSENPVLEFNRIIIDSTKDAAAAYKINYAFYEKEGLAGIRNLEETLEYIPDDILTIADAKRGDIGNTSKMYAAAVFEHLAFDAITVNPYMGIDSVLPFIEFKEKLVFILALTSNKSAEDFEKLSLSNGMYLFQKVISKVNEWNQNGNCGIVFGATNSDELKANISLFENLTVLLPGVGAQGGSLEDVVASFNDAGLADYIINVSRALLYADQSEKFGRVTRNLLNEYNHKIKVLQ